MNAITVENVSKRYLIDHQARADTMRDALTHGVRGLWNRLRSRRLEQEDFWALRDISFEVKPGEVLGIIGRNGAGKSTLLKILSRITEPTTGRIHLRGRVASLLEVGTGFHPELSGRENIFLNGAILGMSRAEITRKFDEIVAFAEVERFLDTPVKRYSSGMYVRLAFAVAAHLEPEILIVDEVLAVGDAQFQKKCLGKMSEVARDSGRTILFVSHNLAAVQALCGRCAYLVGGRLQACGDTIGVLDRYMADTNLPTSLMTGAAREVFSGLWIDALDFTPRSPHSGAPLSFSITLRAAQVMTVTELSLVINAATGPRIAILDLRAADRTRTVAPGRPLTVRGHIPALHLVEGSYLVDAFVATTAMRRDVTELLTLQVLPGITPSSVQPYSARDRGYLEIPFLLLDPEVQSRPASEQP